MNKRIILFFALMANTVLLAQTSNTVTANSVISGTVQLPNEQVLPIKDGIHARSKARFNKTAAYVGAGTNFSTILSHRSAELSGTVVTSCGPYIWPVTGQTLTSSGIYTSELLTQGFTDLTAWNNSVSLFNAVVAINNLAGISLTNPIDVVLGNTTASFSAPGGMYSSGTLIGANISNEIITITFSNPIYGIALNNFATNISDAVIEGDVTATYFNGTTVLFSDTRVGVVTDTQLYGYTSSTGITSVQVSVAGSVLAVNRFVTMKNLSIATDPSATLDLTVLTSVTPTFMAVGPVCSGDMLSALPTTSTNGITGTWSPSINNTATTEYTFTPADGECATTNTMSIVVVPKPTLSTVTAAPACVGNNFTVVLSGLLPNTFGVATYKIANGPTQMQQGTSNASGTFSFTAPAVPSLNGLVLQITKIVSNSCETTFTGKNVTLVVLPAPTLTTVTAEPTCAGTKTFVVLSGMPPNISGTATYKEGNGPLKIKSGTSDANGTFSFPTAVLPASANGLVIEITKLKIAGGCEATFTDKKVTLVVYAQPTLSTVTSQPITAGNAATIVLSGLLPNTTATATYKVNNGILQTQSGTSNAAGKFSFNTSALSLASNGAVVEITKIKNENGYGCETSFINKKVTLVVNTTVNNPVLGKGSESNDENSNIDMNSSISEVNVYPNPVSDILNINATLGIQNVVLLNMIGQQVLSSTEKQINVSHLPSGTYLVRIQDLKNNAVTKRIIIK